MSATSLPLVQQQFVRYIIPIVAALGNFGNILVLILFRKHRKNACALYLSCAAVMNILYLSLSVPLNVYTNERGDPSVYSLLLCKSRFYFFHVWGQVSRYCIVFACIDRFALTHMNPYIRSMSRVKVVYIMMATIIIFWHVFALHIAIMTTVMNGRCGYFGLYSTLNSVYVLIFNCLIPPVTMTIFGYLAFRNMKRLHNRVHVSENGSSSTSAVRRQDRNMLTMLLAEVSVYVMTMSLYPVITFEVAVTASMVKDLQRLQIEGFLQFMSLFLIYLNTSAPFFIYMTVSKAFRREFSELINHGWLRITGNIKPETNRLPLTIVE
jgi:hypothetical protein